MNSSELPEGTAINRETTPFDYIIVGSGAGGGPLASRLALAGKKVLLLEAGSDPAKERSHEFPSAEAGEVHQCPGYHGASTEDSSMSWQFSVRHFADTETQKRDEKYNRLHQSFTDLDHPDRKPVSYPADDRFLDMADSGGRKGGIFYPRAAAVGGCTAHHAMIVAAPNDRDWNYIADLTGDESWRSERMTGYFTKIEKCLYLDDYNGFLQKLLGPIARLWFWLSAVLDPKGALDKGGHGTKGWQPTSFTDPLLVQTIAKKDREFFNVLVKTSLTVLEGRLSPFRYLKEALIRLRLASFVDPNDYNTRTKHPEGVFLIPTGISAGLRSGVRELLEKTRKSEPNNLMILESVHVTRVLFEMGDDNVPLAAGVEYAEGMHLYEASPLFRSKEPAERRKCFAKTEVILCGGSFNTPQLLMLSGIGDSEQLAEIDGLTGLCGTNGQALKKAGSEEEFGFVNLPGVGRNLQDRYEVTVVSELDKEFSTLDGISFTPGDDNDQSRQRWMDEKTGLYAGNGGVLALIRRSKQAIAAGEKEPDLFTFGVPAAFRGYYWGWSRELLRPVLGAPKDLRKLWSWVILKAYTSNDGGTVRLLNSSPFSQPEICFDSFNEAARKSCTSPASVASSDRDVEALADAIAFMRRINEAQPQTFTREIQPGIGRRDNSEELHQWIRSQAWGHHACGTCRIGADAHRPDTAKLLDKRAVLDSRFRVHGVRGLRVVDASVFPKIPGYFILTPIFMTSEKAADTILSDANTEVYPAAFEKLEAAAIRKRRRIALAGNKDAGEGSRLPPQAVGLALSGGGIRSATVCLGVLQALAAKNRLRDIDFLSTVSGGGYTGSFLGRLFTRSGATVQPPAAPASTDPCGKVQEVLKDDNSGAIWWLRNHANYILDAGSEDLRLNLAVYWRNTFTIHAVIGVLFFILFGLGAILAPLFSPYIPALPDLPSLPFADLSGLVPSAWWPVPGIVLVFLLLPLTIGYWLAPLSASYRPYPFYSLLAWLVLVAGAVGLLLLPHDSAVAALGLVVLALSWLAQEIVRWKQDDTPEAGNAEKTPYGSQAKLAMNRLTRSLGVVLVIFGLSVAWVLLDTLALTAASHGFASTLTIVMVVLAPVLPVLRGLANRAMQVDMKSGSGFTLLSANTIGFPIALFLLFTVDVLAHTLAIGDPLWCMVAIVIFTAFSLAIGRSFDFLNRSSLHTAYAARLTRTFQGASNEARIHGSSAASGRNVELAHPDDDIPLYAYHPEKEGGPIHLINVCINDTVDFASDRAVPERKALPMCVGPHGVSVGRRYFATWTPPDEFPRWQKRRRYLDGLDSEDDVPHSKRKPTALRAINLPGDPDTFHVLASQESGSAEVEPLSLGVWTAISGAAFNTALGRKTKPGLALLLGLANVRLGYWWDSGIKSGERPGRYPLGLWRNIKRLPINVFRMQSLLLSEWRGRFHGASRWFWHLSDGGHFDVTGLYELIRRRLPLMICVDAGQDSLYQWEDLAELTRLARIDFGADIRWITPDKKREGWEALEAGANKLPSAKSKGNISGIPAEIHEWLFPDALGTLDEIGRDYKTCNKHAALARVTYASGDEVSWLLLIKPSLSPNLPLDIRNYATLNPPFPQQPTSDQIYDDAQWESYRTLGREIGQQVFAEKPHTL